MLTIEVKDANGNVIAVMTANAKTFSTGSRGYGVSQKIEIGGKRHQVSANFVEIGSKPQS